MRLLLGLLEGKRETNLGCMYTEGGSTVLGSILSFTNQRTAWNHFSPNRDERIRKVVDI